MIQESTRERTFKGGSWDLRKNERRTKQLTIGFPDRRIRGRRMVDKATEGTFASDKLLWMTKSELDE